jgi:SET domain
MTQPTDLASPAATALRSKVAVAGDSDAYHVVAVAAVEAGEVLCRVTGIVTGRPSRHSIQIGERRHSDLPPDTSLDTIKVDATWRFLNHSCAPNAVMRGLEVVALHRIEPGDAVTYHYCTTEFEMAAPFTCECGHPHCLGTVRGFKHLPLEEQTRLRPWLAEHLRRRLDATLPRSSRV